MVCKNIAEMSSTSESESANSDDADSDSSQIARRKKRTTLKKTDLKIKEKGRRKISDEDEINLHAILQNIRSRKKKYNDLFN